jgi:hypothetical protein
MTDERRELLANEVSILTKKVASLGMMQRADDLLPGTGDLKAAIRPFSEADKREMPSQTPLQVGLSR